MTCDLPSIEPKNSGPLYFLHVNAAIDVERLTGDILPVDNQVTNGASYLLRGPNAPQGDALENRLFHLLWNDFIHLGLDEPGADRIDGDVGARQL
jgi:hypothetical protein